MEGTHASQVDAILGALTMPDIGQLFPDNDPRNTDNAWMVSKVVHFHCTHVLGALLLTITLTLILSLT